MAGGASPGTQAFASTLTDLMTSLAVIFILLLVVFLKQAHDQSKKAKNEVQSQLEAFLKQKSLQLKQDPDDPLKLTVMVGETQLRFPVGSSSLSGDGQGYVANFFRNLGAKLCDPSMRDKVDSIVIEGHTDTSGERTPEGVRRNIMLSQKRSFSVLETALNGVQDDPKLYECLLKLTSANGRGSRMPVMNAGIYSPDQSRRVEVKIQVRSAEQQQFKDLTGMRSEAAEPAAGAPRVVTVGAVPSAPMTRPAPLTAAPVVALPSAQSGPFPPTPPATGPAPIAAPAAAAAPATPAALAPPPAGAPAAAPAPAGPPR